MKFNGNPYYSSEQFGLKIIAEIDTAETHEYDMFVVWLKIDDGSVWYATDSGCSCPIPFDKADLQIITEHSYPNFERALESHYNIKKADVIKIITILRKYLFN